ncbi:MAG: replication-relaxation family protein [Anaerolineae bacterium]|nr:replication-relaxation family protein [Anaerolineae bacterium]
MTQRQRKQSSPMALVLSATDLQTALEQDFPDGRWLRALELAEPTGVVTTQQLQRATDLSRDQMNRLLARLEELAPEGLLVRVQETIARPGQRGQPPVVYKLGEAGAALLRASGYPDAHACGLTNATPIAHAVATLDVRLAALQAGLSVKTETLVPYADTELRPDNTVTLPNGRRAFFETEQAAALPQLRRIRESVKHKADFFRSPAADGISTTVRVVINLPRGKAWDQTVGIWERATALVANDAGGDLPFRIVAMPLHEFLATPDWSELPGKRWESLFDPAQTSSFASVETPISKPAERPKSGTAPASSHSEDNLPASLTRRTSHDERLIMEAYWQYLTEHGAELAATEDPQADPEFFAIMRIIYTASYPDEARPWQLALHPYASLFLLRKYLAMRPRLKEALKKALEGRASRVTWNPTTMLHRMQVTIDVFLKYHGFCNGGGLQAYPISNWNREDGSADFRVATDLHPEMLVGGRGDAVPLRDEVHAAERSLAWVLYSLFAYSAEIGLGLRQDYPSFW